jgi:hypothetical protein
MSCLEGNTAARWTLLDELSSIETLPLSEKRPYARWTLVLDENAPAGLGTLYDEWSSRETLRLL